MGETKKTSGFNTFGAILLCIAGVTYLMRSLSFLRYSAVYSLVTFMACVSLIAAGFAFLRKIRSALLPAAFALISLAQIISIFYGIFRGNEYRVVRYSYYGGYEVRFNPLGLLPDIFLLLAFLLATYVAYAACLGPENRKSNVKALWYVPAACGLISLAFTIFLIILYKFIRVAGFTMGTASFGSLLLDLITYTGLFFCFMALAYPDSAPAPGLQASKTAAVNTGSGVTYAMTADDAYAYCGILKHVLLLIFTFGIWYLIWIYRMTAYLNNVRGAEHRDPLKKLLLCIFVPFYGIYWTYKSAQRIDMLGHERLAPHSEIATVCLVLAIFVPFIPPILMQDKVNSLIEYFGAKATPQAEAATKAPETEPATATDFAEAEAETVARAASEAEPAPAVEPEPVKMAVAPKAESAADAADAIMQYKKLLDAGIITREEFETKKAQILGL